MLVQHLSVSGASLLVAKVSVFGAMNVHEVPLLVGLEDHKLVGGIRL